MNKTLVYFTVSEIQMLTARNLLKAAGIESFVINKKDSAYAGIIGDIELYVYEEDKNMAQSILVDSGILNPD